MFVVCLEVTPDEIALPVENELAIQENFVAISCFTPQVQMNSLKVVFCHRLFRALLGT